VVTTLFTLANFLLKKAKKVKKLKQNSEESNDFKTLSQLGQNYQAKRKYYQLFNIFQQLKNERASK